MASQCYKAPTINTFTQKYMDEHDQRGTAMQHFDPNIILHPGPLILVCVVCSPIAL